ncbi:MAG: alpha/beta hydrolase-fold protein [Anaerolineae bacterium]
MPASRIHMETFTSEVLQGNPLGDPAARRVAVYLPPGYDEGKQTYPVVFMLTGFTGRGTMLLNESAWDENIQQRLDRLIESKAILPLIMVMPDCFTRYGGSQYLNSSATGRYEDHVIQELVPWVDRTFRTVPDRLFRAVMGKSSGGYGSLILAMRHPDVFDLMACHSGDTYFELCYGPDFIKYLRSIKKFGGLGKFLQDFPTMHPRESDAHAILNAAAMAACYAPNPQSPYGFDLPFDEYTGEWKPEVWARWKEWDPIDLLDQYGDALRRFRLLYLDCGTRDEFNLQFGARTLCARLDRKGIPYQYQEFDDGHMNIPYRYDVSLAAMSKVWRGEEEAK